MPVLGVTGGVATGKSAFVRCLTQWLPVEVFDADACAHRLLNEDESVRLAILAEFGPNAYPPGETKADRAWLRQQVFGDSGKRRSLEAILHPVIRATWMARAGEFRHASRWLVIDIPLLYETDAAQHFNAVVVVAATMQTQLERMHRNRGLDQTESARMIASQMDLNLKMSRADHVIWNNSAQEHLDRQACLLAGILKKRHG